MADLRPRPLEREAPAAAVAALSDLLADNRRTPEKLRELVISFVAPYCWQDVGGPGDVVCVGEVLAVVHTEEVCDVAACDQWVNVVH